MGVKSVKMGYPACIFGRKSPFRALTVHSEPMKTLTLVHVFETGKTEAVYNAIADLRSFGEAHPFMKTITVIGTPAADETDYHVTETAQLFGFIPFPVTYNARVTIIKPGSEVAYYSAVKKGVMLRIRWLFEKTKPGSVTVTESIEVEGGNMIAGMFIRMLGKAHLKTMACLREKIV